MMNDDEMDRRIDELHGPGTAELLEQFAAEQDESEPPPPWGSPESPITLTLRCQRCGMDMPPVVLDGSDEAKEQLRAINRGAVTTHDVCPTERLQQAEQAAAAAATQRRFEVTCSIREITVDAEDPGQAEHRTEVAGLTVEVTAVSLPEAMRPLALALGEKWMKIEQSAALIDVPLLER